MEGLCSDCGGVDYNWMHRCHIHSTMEFCRGCECPVCAEERDEHYEDLDTEDMEELS